MLNTNQKIEHLRKLGFNGDFEQIERMYNGEKFDVRDEEYRRLLQLSKEYCMRFTQLSELISRAKSAEKIEKYNKEKSEILDNLFPGHGAIYGCGDGLFAIIGTVDLEGFNYINARVHFNASALTHLDEYVFVASNVEFGDNNICTQDGQTQLSRINVGRDTWIGANVNFDNYTEVGEKSVIGMGSHITSNSQLKPSMISFGNPCREYKFITEDYETKVKINKRELLDCIDRATLLVKEGDKKPIIMNITDGTMELKINSFIGSMNEDIDIAKEGKDILIGFNPKFFIDALRVIDEEEVTLYMVNPKAPCFIKDDEGTFIYLILPVNFNAAAN